MGKSKILCFEGFFLNLPFVAGIFIFSSYIVKLLFGYGAFSRLDIESTILATKFYVLALPFFVLWRIFYRIFQIRNKTLLLLFPATIAIVLNALLNYIFLFKLQLSLEGISLATDLSYLTLCLLSLLLLKKIVEENPISALRG